MSDYFFRLPPDSTGKRSTAVQVLHVDYVGHSPQVMENGDKITGDTSGTIGAIIQVHPNSGDPTSGHIEVLLDVESPAVLYQSGEDLLISASVVAQADGTNTPFYTQKNVVSGGNNPFNTASVDNAGALYVRNTEGSQQFDAFGLARSSSPSLMADYRFEYDNLDKFELVTVGGGTLTHLPNESSVAMDCNTASGDKVQLTSHLYHRYQPGFGQYINFTAVSGDAGKTNVIRCWGYYDDNNGIFIELDGAGVINAVLRTSTSGSPTETRIPQESWNSDRLDGAGGAFNLSEYTLDITKMNVFWVDFGWLGSARARLGVFDDNGGRVTCHVFENPGTLSVPYMKTAVLPIRAEIINTGVAASPSRLKIVCASVMTDGAILPDRKRVSVKRSFSGPIKSAITTEAPLATFRSALTVDGVENRKITIPEIFSFYIKDQPAIIRVRRNATLGGSPSFAQHADSAAEIDGAAATATGGDVILTWFMPVGVTRFDAPANFGIQGEHMAIAANGGYGDSFTITAESLEVGATQVAGAFIWIDVE